MRRRGEQSPRSPTDADGGTQHDGCGPRRGWARGGDAGVRFWRLGDQEPVCGGDVYTSLGEGGGWTLQHPSRLSRDP